MASGEMSRGGVHRLPSQTLRAIRSPRVDGAIHFVCMDWRHIGEVLAAGRERTRELKNLCVWVKTNGGMGTLYRSQHELVFVFKVGTAPHINNVELGQHGRYRTNVWDLCRRQQLRRSRDADLAMHPTVKPVALVADAIRDCSKRNGLILDAFAGSAPRWSRPSAPAVGGSVELDPAMSTRASAAGSMMTGKHAVLAATGESFETVADARAAEATHG